MKDPVPRLREELPPSNRVTMETAVAAASWKVLVVHFFFACVPLFLCQEALSNSPRRILKGFFKDALRNDQRALNVSSTPALAGHDKGFSFTVAKAAIIGLTRGLAYELAPYVRVNTIALGNISTE